MPRDAVRCTPTPKLSMISFKSFFFCNDRVILKRAEQVVLLNGLAYLSADKDKCLPIYEKCVFTIMLYVMHDKLIRWCDDGMTRARIFIMGQWVDKSLYIWPDEYNVLTFQFSNCRRVLVLFSSGIGQSIGSLGWQELGMDQVCYLNIAC